MNEGAMTVRKIRTHKVARSRPMSARTANRLFDALERRYPGKVWRVVEVCPVAVVKTVDNEADAQETLRRLANAEGRPSTP